MRTIEDYVEVIKVDYLGVDPDARVEEEFYFNNDFDLKFYRRTWEGRKICEDFPPPTNPTFPLALVMEGGEVYWVDSTGKVLHWKYYGEAEEFEI